MELDVFHGSVQFGFGLGPGRSDRKADQAKPSEFRHLSILLSSIAYSASLLNQAQMQNRPQMPQIAQMAQLYHADVL
jgi:hypothetical protein